MNELQEIKDRIARLEEKADAILTSTEKTRRYFKATLIITVLTVVVPAIGLVFAIPFLMKTISGSILDAGMLEGLQ